MLDWFRRGEGTVALFDATNSTRKRRRWVKEICEQHDIDVLYVESKCDDEGLIMANIREVKTTSPDYRGQDPELAAQDFRDRIRNYEKVYETIDDEEQLTYCKIVDVGARVLIGAIKDYLQSRVVYYLMNLHIKPRSIYLSRVCLRFRPLFFTSNPLFLLLRLPLISVSLTIPARRIHVQSGRKDWWRRASVPSR